MLGRAVAVAVAVCVGAGVANGCGGKHASSDYVKPPPGPGAPFTPPEGADGIKPTALFRVTQPTHVAISPGDDGLMLVTQKTGEVIAVRDGKKLPQPFVDLSKDVGEPGYEQGLLSAAFAPDFERSGLVYFFHTDTKDKLNVVEFRRSEASPDVADPQSRRLVFKGDHPTAPADADPVEQAERRVHNAGQLQLGPDGLLYLSTGDGGPQGDPNNNGQNPDSQLGKILRIDPSRPGARTEMVAYGLRNPYRFSFDRETGDIYIGDVGYGEAEEINLVPAGETGLNFGWKCFEGTTKVFQCDAPGHVPPLIERPGTNDVGAAVSIIGGYVVRDKRLPSLEGQYLYADFYTGALRAARVRDGKLLSDRGLELRIATPSSFGEDTRGRLYTTSLGNGWVHRLDPAP